MKHTIITPRFIFVLTVMLVAALIRLLPHWPNLTPIAAMALFGGTYFGKKYLAFLIPLATMFVTDLVLGLHASMIAVYVGFSITVLIGFILRSRVRPGTVILASLTSSVIFFVITNFASWLTSPFYDQTFAGLLQCYTAGLVFFNNGSYGISFFLNEVLGTLFFNAVCFGAFYLSQLQFPALEKADQE